MKLFDETLDIDGLDVVDQVPEMCAAVDRALESGDIDRGMTFRKRPLTNVEMWSYLIGRFSSNAAMCERWSIRLLKWLRGEDEYRPGNETECEAGCASDNQGFSGAGPKAS